MALTRALERTIPLAYVDAMSAFLKWIDGAEEILKSDIILLTEPDEMHHQLTQYEVNLVLI